MNELIDFFLLVFLVATAVAILRLRSLFASAMVFGIYSLLCAGVFVILDAADVAFTEAAVGAGISTILILGTLALIGRRQETGPSRPALSLVAVVAVGALLIYGTYDMPRYGDPKAPVHEHVVPRYIEESPHEIGIPNIVTSVLASYRGYDTLGEVTVIFTAGIGVLCLLGRGGLRPRRRDGT